MNNIFNDFPLFVKTDKSNSLNFNRLHILASYALQKIYVGEKE